MLSNNFALCKNTLNKYTTVFSTQYVSYCQPWASLSVWCQLLTAQVETELKTPQMLTGKREWCDWTHSWTWYHKWWWSVMSQICQHTARFSSFEMWPCHWVLCSSMYSYHIIYHISYHIIYHIISYHISYHIISYIISYHIVYHIISS